MPRAVAIVALPPPTHGQSVVNQAIVDALSANRLPLKVVNTSPGSLTRGPRYHARRLRSYLSKAIPSIFGARKGVVYTVVEWGHGMAYNFLVVLVARTVRASLVLHHHTGLYTKRFDRRFSWLARLAGRNALHVALDEFMARDLRERYPCIERVVVAHNASHVAAPDVVEHGDRTLTCGFMSNLNREKGLGVFLDCLRLARDSGLKLQAVLAGPAASEEAEQMIAQARVEFGDALKVMGPVASASKDLFFKSIDVFFFPTRLVEGQPLVILEAMSYGVPVVATRQGYCAELIGEAGVSAPIESFAAAAVTFMDRCQNDVEHLRNSGMAARQRFDLLKQDADVQMNDLIRKIAAMVSERPATVI